MNKYKQRGYNILWPLVIETWNVGDPIPEWLRDLAKVKFMDGEGNITLETRDLRGGGMEIIQAGSTEALVRLKSLEDSVYISLPASFPLPPDLKPIHFPKIPKVITKEQLKILYKNYD